MNCILHLKLILLEDTFLNEIWTLRYQPKVVPCEATSRRATTEPKAPSLQTPRHPPSSYRGHPTNNPRLGNQQSIRNIPRICHGLGTSRRHSSCRVGGCTHHQLTLHPIPRSCAANIRVSRLMPAPSTQRSTVSGIFQMAQ
jgi:hypothetical protein